jgi:uncharacterized membrane protein YgdD (TMEM256/DUF423 family)
MSAPQTIALGALSALLAVATGAFGAHGLAARLAPRFLEIWKTGAHYHLVHSLALVAVGIWLSGTSLEGFPASLARAAAGAFTFGIVVFSGSLYLLALTEIRWLGAITPIGGLGMMAGWGLMAAAALWGTR